MADFDLGFFNVRIPGAAPDWVALRLHYATRFLSPILLENIHV